MKNYRIIELIKILLSSKEYITTKKLSELLSTSQRTIHNDLCSFEFRMLIDGCELIKTPHRGILLKYDDELKNKILYKLKSPFTTKTDKNDDLSSILVKLINANHMVNLEYLKLDLYKSTSSLNLLLSDLNGFLKDYDCTLESRRNDGLTINGNEFDIRKFYYHFFYSENFHVDFSHSNNRTSARSNFILDRMLTQKQKESLISIVQACEEIMTTHFVDEDFNSFLVQLSILIKRTLNSNYIENISFDHDLQQEYHYATLIKLYIEKDFNVILTENEIKYISLLLLSKRKQTNILNDEHDSLMLEKFINLLSVRLNIDLTKDFTLRQSLNNHLKPAIKRMRHGLASQNPLLDQIKNNYTEIYITVNTVVEDLEAMEKIYFDQNEIGYICLHVIAAINRPTNKQRFNAALICNEGLSLEVFLKNIIESYFPEISITTILRENSSICSEFSKYELVINSTRKRFNEKNVINIETHFSQKDHASLRHLLANKIISTNDLHLDLFKNYLVFFKDDCATQNELIEKYCKFLTNKRFVKPNFFNTVLQRQKVSSTYVARGIAVPHGSKDEVLNSVILIINCSKPIFWDDDYANTIILVASNDQDARNFSLLFRKIMRIASDDQLSEQLKKCEDVEDVRKLIDFVKN